MLPGAQSTQVTARFFEPNCSAAEQQVRFLAAALVHGRASEGLDVHGDLPSVGFQDQKASTA